MFEIRLITARLILLISLLFIAEHGTYAQEPAETHFYFVQITDTHFGEGDHLERTRKAVERINNLPMEIKCVV
ncbi:MAG: hypothetical protein KAQ99_00375, partial [Candidatus Aureabacteria bacterium]|nr:hypothetical protein [Candidatus Auribacterota bacterium]